MISAASTLFSSSSTRSTLDCFFAFQTRRSDHPIIALRHFCNDRRAKQSKTFCNSNNWIKTLAEFNTWWLHSLHYCSVFETLIYADSSLILFKWSYITSSFIGSSFTLKALNLWFCMTLFAWSYSGKIVSPFCVDWSERMFLKFFRRGLENHSLRNVLWLKPKDLMFVIQG